MSDSEEPEKNSQDYEGYRRAASDNLSEEEPAGEVDEEQENDVD